MINQPTTDKIRPVEELAADDDDISQATTSAADTISGATSKSVYHGIGKPAQGQSSAELHHDGRTDRKREGKGTAQFGPQGGSILTS